MKQVPETQWREVLSRYGIHKPFVLHLGAPAPRKNTRRVLEAWALIGSRSRKNNQLLSVGLDGDSYKETQHRVHNLGLTESVRLSGFADEQDMPTLMSAAKVLAYPSLSEGFGLPILDAWETQTPVLTSDTTSLPKIAGNAALQVDPTDPRNIAAGMHRLISDKALRQQMIDKANERKTQFSWDKTADRFIEVIENAVSIDYSFRQAA